MIILDTNVLIDASRSRYPDYRILKDAGEGGSFSYFVTLSQMEDMARSNASKVERYSPRFIKEIVDKHKVGILNVEHRRYNPLVRKILKAGPIRRIEETDIQTVEVAIQENARHVISRDRHLAWEGVNEVLCDFCDTELTILTPNDFCKMYDGKIVELSRMEKLRNVGKRGVIKFLDYFKT